MNILKKDISKKPYNINLMAGIIMIGTFVMVLNQTILFTALPHIMKELNINATTVQWLSTGYMLTNGVLIPVTAFLSERFTTRQLFITAMSMFFIGTLIAVFSNSFSTLLLARIIQALGAGITMPLMQMVLFTIYPKEKRGFIMGLAGLVIGFGPAIGPTLSGFIIDNFSWIYIFIIVSPITLIILILSTIYIKNVTKVNKNRKFDFISVILSTLGFGSLLYATSSSNILLYLGIGIILVILFIFRQSKLDTPMLEFKVFKYYTFSLATIIAIVSFISLISIETLLPMYIQNLRNMSALDSGLILLPGAIISGVMSPISGRLVDKIGGKYIAILGSVIIALSTIPFIFLTIDMPIILIIIVYALRLIGTTLTMMPVTTLALNSLPNNLINHGSAVINTFRQVIGSIGTAFLITTYSNMSNKALETGTITDPISAQIYGMSSSFIVGLILACIGIVVSLRLKKS